MMLDGAGIFMEIIFLKNSSNLTSSHQTMNSMVTTFMNGQKI